jgi:cellulose synthase/poly-beta-1,6-N-acetylglucosamine synthase-like glycosyltransferase
MRAALEILFWASVFAIAWTQLGYALLIALLARLLAPAPGAIGASRERAHTHPRNAVESTLSSVSLIVAAHDEQAVIGAKVANALALDYPRELLELIVACDGCSDATPVRAREAGADVVLELPRGGKIAAQDAAVERARGEILAFSDANAQWDAGALRELVSAFGDQRVGYACGRVRFVQGVDGEPEPSGAQAPSGAPPVAGGRQATNQEGVYWRYEMALRERESRLGSITAGNGAIYATRRDSYIVVDPIMGHDLSFPFNMVKRGWRAVEAPKAGATEKMVPSIEGEWRRKRRMMSHTWPIVLRGGMLSPRGYPPAYAFMIVSHRLLRYLIPFLHAIALVANVALVAGGASALYTATFALQLALLGAAALAGALPARSLLIARYYVLTAASPAAGLWDWLRHGTPASWQAAEGTR